MRFPPRPVYAITCANKSNLSLPTSFLASIGAFFVAKAVWLTPGCFATCFRRNSAGFLPSNESGQNILIRRFTHRSLSTYLNYTWTASRWHGNIAARSSTLIWHASDTRCSVEQDRCFKKHLLRETLVRLCVYTLAIKRELFTCLCDRN